MYDLLSKWIITGARFGDSHSIIDYRNSGFVIGVSLTTLSVLEEPLAMPVVTQCNLACSFSPSNRSLLCPGHRRHSINAALIEFNCLNFISIPSYALICPLKI